MGNHSSNWCERNKKVRKESFSAHLSGKPTIRPSGFRPSRWPPPPTFMYRGIHTRNPPFIRKDKTYRQPSVWAGIIHATVALTSGTKLGPYEIVSPLGAGGMGEVYRARDTRLGRDVAIKVLPTQVSGDTTRRERFEREARAVSAPSSRALVVEQPQSTRVEGADIVMKSSAFFGMKRHAEKNRRGPAGLLDGAPRRILSTG